eukprot:14081030-Ditylum_brightwellii.AAC.1
MCMSVGGAGMGEPGSGAGTQQSKRRHCCSNKTRQNHRNHQINDNHHNPNFDPAFKRLEKGAGGWWW